MKRIKYLLFAGASAFFIFSQAQPGGYVGNALLFAGHNAIVGSTARMQGLAGTQVSLGADMSSAGSNPAGLGMYNRSVVSFTPSLNFNTTDAAYKGSMLSNYNNNFNFANLGVVLNMANDRVSDKKFKSGSFAVTLQRANSFNQRFSYAGRNSANSITDSFIGQARALGGIDGKTPKYAADYAYNQFLIERAEGYNFIEDENGLKIFPAGSMDNLVSLVGASSEGLFTPRQSELVERKGGNYALNFAWGGNYGDQVYFGAGLAYKNIDYEQNRSFEENSYQSGKGIPDDLVRRIRFDDSEKVQGKGVDFTGGLIIRPVDFITLGVSYTSPTFYSLEREFEYRLRTDYGANVFYYDENSGTDSLFFELGGYDTRADSLAPPLFAGSYNLKTDSRLTVGASFFVGKHGFISGEAEFVDYRSMKIKSDDVVADGADNEVIRAVYKSVANYRLGAEYRLENFRFRMGYAFYADPYRSAGIDVTQKFLTFGAGFRSEDFFADLAVVNQSSNELYAPYSTSANQPEVNVDSNRATVSATIGFNF